MTQLTQLTDIQIFMLVILFTLIISWSAIFIWLNRAKTESKKEEELLVTEHKILIGYKIAAVWVEDDEVFFIYE